MIIPTLLIENEAGNTWFNELLKIHPQIRKIDAKNINLGRTQVDATPVHKYLSELSCSLMCIFFS